VDDDVITHLLSCRPVKLDMLITHRHWEPNDRPTGDWLTTNKESQSEPVAEHDNIGLIQTNYNLHANLRTTQSYYSEVCLHC